MTTDAPPVTTIMRLTICAAGSGLWESGGGMTNTGRAQIITGTRGEKLAPLLVNRRGSLACGEHALLPAVIGGFVVQNEHHREDHRTTIWRISGISGEHATLERYDHWDGSAWERSEEWPELLGYAVGCAVQKSTEYHCRESIYTTHSVLVR